MPENEILFCQMKDNIAYNYILYIAYNYILYIIGYNIGPILYRLDDIG